MSVALPKVWLVRHGETEWSLSGRHTGRNDIPLTPRGEQNARDVGERLRGKSFTAVFTSPLQRTRKTCELAGYPKADALPDLMEWNYGTYEGLTQKEIDKIAAETNRPKERVKEVLSRDSGLERLRGQIRNKKTLDFLQEKAQVRPSN